MGERGGGSCHRSLVAVGPLEVVLILYLFHLYISVFFHQQDTPSKRYDCYIIVRLQTQTTD